jgi:hypothetical protein
MPEGDWLAELSKRGCEPYANIWQVPCQDCRAVPDLIHSFQDPVSRVVNNYCPVCCPNCGDAHRRMVIQ